MTTPQTPTMPTTVCPNCGDTVPTGAYCGACGTHLVLHHETSGRTLRSHSYAAAPGEHVLRISVVSSLFPHLPHRSRAPFRVALVVVAAALIALASAKLQAPMIAVATLGVPLLFELYLRESDVYEDFPLLLLAVAVVIGAGLGVGWALLAAHDVTTSIGANLFGGADPGTWLISGVLIPVIGAALMLVPAVVVRFIRPPHLAESMDGFVIGSIGAVAFTAAATITRLAPELSTGIVARDRSVTGIVVEALLQGGTVPLTAAGAGAVVGATLWLRRRDRVHLGAWLTSPVLAIPAVLLLYIGLGLIDIWQPGDEAVLGLHAVAALIVLVAMRYGVHAVLLHEEHDVTIGPPRVCPHCEHVVPAMPFCPHCGHAARAASRSVRNRLHLPEQPPAVAEGGELA